MKTQTQTQTIKFFKDKAWPYLFEESNWTNFEEGMQNYYNLVKDYDIPTILACQAVTVGYQLEDEADKKYITAKNIQEDLEDIRKDMQEFLTKFHFWYKNLTLEELWEKTPEYAKITTMLYIINNHCS